MNQKVEIRSAGEVPYVKEAMLEIVKLRVKEWAQVSVNGLEYQFIDIQTKGKADATLKETAKLMEKAAEIESKMTSRAEKRKLAKTFEYAREAATMAIFRVADMIKAGYTDYLYHNGKEKTAETVSLIREASTMTDEQLEAKYNALKEAGE